MAPPVPGNAEPEGRDGAGGVATAVARPADAARRFHRFVLLDLAVAVAGVVVLLVVLLVVRTPLAWPLVAVTVVTIGLLAWSLPLYDAGRVDRAVLVVCVTFWLQLVLVPWVVPSLFGGFAVLMVWPVLFAIPYVTRRTLRLISVATAVCALVAVVLAVRAVVPVVSGLPTLLVQVVFLFVAVAFLALSLTVLYAYSGRLGEVVDGLRDANDALHESERSLERNVADRTAELAAVLDNLAEGLLVVDPGGDVVRVNHRLEEMVGRPAHRLLHRPAVDVLPELEGLGSSPATGSSTRAIRLAEERLGQAVSSTIVRAADGTSRGTVILIRDVTVEVEVDRMKTDFISTVSHELRTPLTSILGFTKIIAKRLDEKVFPAVPDPTAPTTRAMAQVRGNLDIVATEGQRLTALVDDLLDLAKMEAGRVVWRDELVDLGDVVRTVAATMAPLYDDKALPLQVELDPDLPVVRGDRHRLEQVLLNLLSNAGKFTTTGSVTVRTHRDAGYAVVSVTDTGPGVAPEDRADLFLRFKQVGDTLTGKPQGTGLGLPICQEIVEHHGGRIEVDSEVGVGSTFSFSVPFPPSDPPST